MRCGLRTANVARITVTIFVHWALISTASPKFLWLSIFCPLPGWQTDDSPSQNWMCSGRLFRLVATKSSPAIGMHMPVWIMWAIMSIRGSFLQEQPPQWGPQPPRLAVRNGSVCGGLLPSLCPEGYLRATAMVISMNWISSVYPRAFAGNFRTLPLSLLGYRTTGANRRSSIYLTRTRAAPSGQKGSLPALRAHERTPPAAPEATGGRHARSL